MNDRSGPRIVLFTWHSRKNLSLVLPLANYLREACNADIEFITSDTSGRILLGLEGYKSSTVNELILAYADRPDVSLGEYPPNLGALDIKVDWLWTPPNPLPPPEGYERLSREYMQWKVRQFLRSYTNFLLEVAPDVVFTWNGTLAVTRCLTEVAAKADIPCYFLERGLLPETLVVDKKGVNYYSALAGPLAEPVVALDDQRKRDLLAFCDEFRDSAQSIVNTGEHLDEDEIRERLKIPDGEQIILLPLQIESDTNIVENSPIVRSMLNLVARVGEAVSGERYCVIVKPHPEDAQRRPELEKACSHDQLRCSWDHSLHSLLAVADLAIVINSTVGLEAVLQNIPTLTLGNSVYSEKGFTTDVRDFTDLRSAIMEKTTHPYELTSFWIFLDRLLSGGLFSYDQSDPWHNRSSLSREINSLAIPSERSRALSAECGRTLARARLRELLEGQVGEKTVVLGGFESPPKPVPDNIFVIASLKDLLRWFIRFSRPDTLIAIQKRQSRWKQVLTLILMPRAILDVD